MGHVGGFAVSADLKGSSLAGLNEPEGWLAMAGYTGASAAVGTSSHEFEFVGIPRRWSVHGRFSRAVHSSVTAIGLC